MSAPVNISGAAWARSIVHPHNLNASMVGAASTGPQCVIWSTLKGSGHVSRRAIVHTTQTNRGCDAAATADESRLNKNSHMFVPTLAPVDLTSSARKYPVF